MYPSRNFEQTYDSKTPEIFALVVVSVFILVAITFLIFDSFVQRRNRKIIANAAKSNAIVTSLFPGTLRDKVLEDVPDERPSPSFPKPHTVEKTTFLADLYLETSVCFADVSKTVWFVLSPHTLPSSFLWFITDLRLHCLVIRQRAGASVSV